MFSSIDFLAARNPDTNNFLGRYMEVDVSTLQSLTIPLYYHLACVDFGQRFPKDLNKNIQIYLVNTMFL